MTDHEFLTISDLDREYAKDLADDLREHAETNWFDDAELQIIAEWFRKARHEAVLAFRLNKS